MNDIQLEYGRFYQDGNGDVHGPMRPHPNHPEHFIISSKDTYYHDGRHVLGDISEGHHKLNIVREIEVVAK